MSLADLLRRRIEMAGPMPVADYMALCLSHPQHGYYMTRDPFGAAGDFTTAPEISQMFGELVGLALAQAWIDQGRPGIFCLAELGPGRGTLMADALRATRAVPGFHAAMQLHLVETSPVLRQAQAERLSGHAPNWTDRIETLPGLPLFMVANEVFDALPVHQYERRPEGWRERLVGLSQGRLGPGLGPPADLGLDAPDGTVMEHCPMGEAIAETLGAHLAAHGGCALILDYGEWEGTGDTLQAVSGHRHADPYATPGEADLTAHVQFGPLAIAAAEAGAQPAGFRPQGDWLEALGLSARAAALARSNPGRAEEIEGQRARLSGPRGMGRLFKILALTGPDAPPPPGFERQA